VAAAPTGLYKVYFIDDNGKLHPISRYEYRWEQFNRNYEFVASRIAIRGAG
jgi:hypothetical protein